MSFCLPKELSNKFKQGLKDGSIDPGKLAKMSSEQRRAALAEFVGEGNAKYVNKEFESKLLLKNQQQGMITWAEKIAGIKPQTKKDLLSKIQRMENVLSAENEEQFLQDLASTRMGTNVSFEEATKITQLAKEAENAKKIAEDSGWDETARIQYGDKVLAMKDFIDELNPVVTKDIVTNIIGLPTTLMTTADLSFGLRQGWGMWSRPEFYKAFVKQFGYALKEENFQKLRADIISRPTYEAMKSSGLRLTALAGKVGDREDVYMSRLAQRIPGLGAIFRGSERAYVGMANKLRADVFDTLYRAAKVNGEDVSIGSSVLKDIANTVNDFTGSGNILPGDVGKSALPHIPLFSARKLSATMNMFNPERYLNPNISPTARKAATRQLLGSLSASVSLLSLAALAGAKVETDPRSANFGKFQIGNTRYDLTGGNAGYAVLLARLISNKTKSSINGKLTKLGDGYRAKTRADLIVDFTRNKLSPTASFFADLLYGKNAVGDEFKMSDALKNRLMPLVISNTIDTAKEDKSQLVGTILADLFGIGVQTY